ncbi:hypothetical protein Gohar_001556, partial [Gossypium harknessii]|nr:hypothetical protein [Gossypium harknessii]
NRFLSGQNRFRSSYAVNLGRRLRDADEASEAASLREIHHGNDPKAVIRLFESQPSLHSNPSALSEYVTALVKVDGLDESELLKTLQRGISSSAVEEESKSGLSAFQNVGKSTKHGVLGTASAPIHMATAEGGSFKDQFPFPEFCLTGILVLGLGLHEEVQVVESNTKFNDVKGVDEAKAELEEIVHYLRDPKVNALFDLVDVSLSLPHFLSLITFTLLAAFHSSWWQASKSGSEFEEMFVGVGARRVRDLFAAAKKRSPCIIFIDEIDAIGGSRNPKDQQYMRMTLNQLLVELDGFKQNEGIILIAATNFPESLDKALIRPGRFDRRIIIPYPDVEGRRQILESH